MGTVTHWVHKFEPAKLASAAIFAITAIACSNIIASAISGREGGENLVIHLNVNERGIQSKAFRVNPDGTVTEVPVPKK